MSASALIVALAGLGNLPPHERDHAAVPGSGCPTSKRPFSGPPDAEQGPGDNPLLLDHQDPLHHGWRDRCGPLERKPRPWSDQHDLHHGRAADRHARLPAQVEEVRAGDLLARGRPDQRRRHAVQRQPRGQPGRALQTTTIAFSVILALVFGAWYASERTLSVHTIVTSRREGFYWLAILFTFALGTSAGDLVAEQLELGYLPSVGIFAGAIAIVTLAHFRFKLNAILAFWIAYILTRPLGASIGDFLSQPVNETGLGLGTILTSAIFLTTILALVVYLTVTKRDLIAVSSAEAQLDGHEADGEPRVLVVTNKTDATPAVIEAVRERAIAGPARFFVLVPNPDHLAFDRNSTDTSLGEKVLKRALPLLEEPAGTEVEGRVAASPNAYDDIVEELKRGDYREIILETLPSHVSHWLHVDLPDGWPTSATRSRR